MIQKVAEGPGLTVRFQQQPEINDYNFYGKNLLRYMLKLLPLPTRKKLRIVARYISWTTRELCTPHLGM